ncbi:MAG: cardiolipin synthase [Tannerellaceae bacterium]|nr:cardiolipin synthase [Tannerellaceae bacterium]
MQASIQTFVGTMIFLAWCIPVLGLTLVTIMENRNPLKTIAWVMVLITLPGIGLIVYFLFGQDNRRQRIISRHAYKRILRHPAEADKHHQDNCNVPEAYRPLSLLLGHNSLSTPLYGSRIDVYTNGPDKFKALFEDIEKAEMHIHFQYYILLDDEIGRRVKELLIAKAKAGVRVRLMYDDVGSWNVSKAFYKEMEDAGIEVYPFLRVVFPIFTSKVNYRNHRKVVVIDGKVGFIGGMNVADRYMKGNALGKWRDTHFRITGKGVHGLQSAFLVDWYVVSKKLLNGMEFYPQAPVLSNGIMQILTSGPVGPWRLLLQAMTYMVLNAKKYVYIQTPYFLPTEGLNQALQAAALGGVDVRLMLPKKSDTRSAHIASHSYIDDMLKAGVKVFFYLPGFLHSKLALTDDALTCIGSANLDFRSFEHNFEITAFVYHSEFALQMKRIFQHDIHDCEKLNPSQWLRRPRKQRMAESFMRLFSPLL